MDTERSIPPVGPTGKERWNKLVVLERIRGEARALILKATIDPRANMPEVYDWARDLRRGRTNILGGLFRLVDVMHRQKTPQGRRIALDLLALAAIYIDLELPETTVPSPNAEAVPFGPRIYKQEASRRMA